MSFILRHFTEIVGSLALCWGLFSLGRLYEREHSDPILVTPEHPWMDDLRRRDGLPVRRGPYNWRDEEI